MNWIPVYRALTSRIRALSDRPDHDWLEPECVRLTRLRARLKRHVRQHYDTRFMRKGETYSQMPPEDMILGWGTHVFDIGAKNAFASDDERGKLRAEKRRQNHIDAVASLRRQMAGYDTIIYFDAEWSASQPKIKPITEVGMVVVTKDTVRAYNFRVDSWGAKSVFRHGEDIVLPEAEMRERVREIIETADAFFIHAADGDKKQMEMWGCPFTDVPIHDTARLSRQLSPTKHAMSLKHLARHYGVQFMGWHSAGNDAMAVHDIVKAMIVADQAAIA